MHPTTDSLPVTRTPPPAIADTFPTQLEQALKQNTLLDAMAYLCMQESNRIAQCVVTALQKSSVPTFDSYFTTILPAVTSAWIAAGKPLTDFQPNFCPPPPTH